MHRIDSVTAREDVNGIGKKGFSDNVDLPQHDATYVTPEWCNSVQEELAHVVESVGMTLDKNDNTQLATAIIELVKPVLRLVYHVGSVHATKNLNYDPAVALEEVFGYQTRWVLREGALYGVANLTDAIDHEINISGSASAKARTLRIWERLPDADPVYTLTASSNGVDEGTEITVFLQTEHLQAGDKVGWQITVNTGTFSVSPNQKSGFFIVDANGQASYTFTVDTASTTNQVIKMTLFGTDTYLDIPIYKPRFLSWLLGVKVDQLPDPTTHYDYRYWTLNAYYQDMNLHENEEVTVNLSGTAMQYLYEMYSSDPVEYPDDPLAQTAYSATIQELQVGSNTGTIFGLGRGLYVKSTAPQNLTLTAELVWRNEVVQTRTVTVHVPE